MGKTEKIENLKVDSMVLNDREFVRRSAKLEQFFRQGKINAIEFARRKRKLVFEFSNAKRAAKLRGIKKARKTARRGRR